MTWWGWLLTCIGAWLLCGLIAARIEYCYEVRRHGGSCYGCSDCLGVRAAQWFGPLSLIGWLLTLFVWGVNRAADWIVNRPTWTQRREARLQKLREMDAERADIIAELSRLHSLPCSSTGHPTHYFDL